MILTLSSNNLISSISKSTSQYLLFCGLCVFSFNYQINMDFIVLAVGLLSPIQADVAVF